MIAMAKKKGEPKRGLETFAYVRTTAGSKLALDLLLAQLKARGRLGFLGGKITQEALVNASWLWMGELGAEEVERILGPYLDRLEAMLPAAPAEPQPVVVVGREPDYVKGRDEGPAESADPKRSGAGRRKA